MIVINSDGGLLKIMYRDNYEAMTGLTAHPTMPHLATCSLTGLLKIFDYEEKTVVVMSDFGVNNPIQTCRFNCNGQHLALGFVNGHVRVLDSLTLKEVTSAPFTFGRGAITHIDFDPFNRFCAYTDSAFTTTLLCSFRRLDDEPWNYLGRIRAHYRKISDLRFWRHTGSKTCRLFTVSEDQILAEYDLRNSTRNNIVLLSRCRVEQMFVPLCVSSLPSYYKEEFLLMSTSSSKFKLIDTTSFTCRKVVMLFPQGILYHKVLPLPSSESATSHFLICLSEERLALVILPLDGDPLKCTNLIAHPSSRRGRGKAEAMAVSYCGKYVFTAGGPDTCVHMWRLKPELLVNRVKKACDIKRRFYDLLSSEALHELKDYFYYSMLRTQGLQCLNTRNTSLKIPLSEIPYVLRAIGFYPTENEICNMTNEIKYSKFAATGTYTENVDLDTFIQMYCNYRLHQGTLFQEIEAAFDYLCHVRDCDTGKSFYFRDPRASCTMNAHIPPEFLFSYLQTVGEPIEEAEMVESLAIMLGNYPEGGRPEATEPIIEAEVIKQIDAKLPMFLNAQNFVHRILGFTLCKKVNIEGDYYHVKLRMHNSNFPDVPTHPDKSASCVSSEAQTE